MKNEDMETVKLSVSNRLIDTVEIQRSIIFLLSVIMSQKKGCEKVSSVSIPSTVESVGSKNELDILAKSEAELYEIIDWGEKSEDECVNGLPWIISSVHGRNYILGAADNTEGYVIHQRLLSSEELSYFLSRKK